MFRCKGKDGVVRETTWKLIEDAWLAAVTVCEMNLDRHPITTPGIPLVTGLELESSGNEVTVSWNPSNRYKTEIQYRLDDGDWVTLPLVNVGASEY